MDMNLKIKFYKVLLPQLREENIFIIMVAPLITSMPKEAFLGNSGPRE